MGRKAPFFMVFLVGCLGKMQKNNAEKNRPFGFVFYGLNFIRFSGVRQ